MALLNKLSHIGMGKESTIGTSVAPTIYIPVSSLKTEDLIHFVQDDSLFNNQSLVRGQYAGEKDSTFDFDGMLYPEDIGTFLVAAGLADTVTGTSSPFTHTFKLTASSQPPTYTLYDFDVYETHKFPGAILDQLDLTIDAKGAIKQACKFLAWPSASTSNNAPAFPASAAFLGWETAVTLNGSSTPQLVSAGITIKRTSETIHTLNNTQSPYTSFAGPIEVTTKVKALFENDVVRNLFLNNTQGNMVLTITAPTGSPAPVLTITSTVNAVIKGSLDRSAKYVQIDLESSNVYNTTDGGPLAVTLVNGTAGAY